MDKKERPVATRADWKTEEMPEKNTTFILEREFTAEQIAALRRGNIPRAMEDKWFLFMEGDTFYAHRSWTGVCVYRIDFSFSDNRHKVTVNQDPKQVRAENVKEQEYLNNLLNWWTMTAYDHYGEWIFETANSLKKAGWIPKSVEDCRREAIKLELQGNYEEAFLKYEEAAKMDDAPSMIRISKLYLSGKLRPVDSSNPAESSCQSDSVTESDPDKEKQPDYQSGLEWLMKAADLGNGYACENAGLMLCKGIGCNADVEKGISYLEKAVANGQDSARGYISLFRPEG